MTNKYLGRDHLAMLKKAELDDGAPVCLDSAFALMGMVREKLDDVYANDANLHEEIIAQVDLMMCIQMKSMSSILRNVLVEPQSKDDLVDDLQDEAVYWRS